MTTVVFAEATTDDVQDFMQTLGWISQPAANSGELAWQPEATDAVVTWHPLDDTFGAFLLSGSHADVARADLGAVFDLQNDVDAMNAIASASTPQELVTWARRLGEFTRGDEVYQATLGVIKGLLASDDAEFVAATVRGLERARWPELVVPLEETARRWPALQADCDKALASIRTGQRL